MVELDNKSFLIIVLGLCLLFTVCICLIAFERQPTNVQQMYSRPNGCDGVAEYLFDGTYIHTGGQTNTSFPVGGNWYCEKCGIHSYYQLPQNHKVGELKR